MNNKKQMSEIGEFLKETNRTTMSFGFDKKHFLKDWINSGIETEK